MSEALVEAITPSFDQVTPQEDANEAPALLDPRRRTHYARKILTAMLRSSESLNASWLASVLGQVSVGDIEALLAALRSSGLVEPAGFGWVLTSEGRALTLDGAMDRADLFRQSVRGRRSL